MRRSTKVAKAYFAPDLCAGDGKGQADPVSSQADESAVPGIDTSRPHPARTYNYALGGKDHISQGVWVGPYSATLVPIQ